MQNKKVKLREGDMIFPGDIVWNNRGKCGLGLTLEICPKPPRGLWWNWGSCSSGVYFVLTKIKEFKF